ncbi:hypothetical protein K438DRAFT_1791167 [Mycena galopus ATCC 62051]|nr:hypothetical protein K438DRAFT_1791167 [Mycena galopus ATCC 62051]
MQINVNSCGQFVGKRMEADNCVHLPSENPSSTPPVQKKQRCGPETLLVCTNCTKTGGNLRRCSKCGGTSIKVVVSRLMCPNLYLPEGNCAVDDEYDFGDLVTNAYGNPIFNKIIQALFILQFDLPRSPRLDQLFAAAVEFSVEPVDFQDFVKIFADQPLGKRKIPGVVQVNSFKPFTPLDIAGMRPNRWHIWRHAKESLANSADPEEAHFVGFVEVAYGENRQVIVTPMLISKRTVERVRGLQPWQRMSPTTGRSTEQPFNIESCMEFLNDYIKQDRTNEMRLRTDLLPPTSRSSGKPERGHPATHCSWVA